jgi:hypothetical protein
MHAAGQHAEKIGVVEGDGNEHVVRRDAGVEELENAMLGSFDGGDIARQAGQRVAQILT